MRFDEFKRAVIGRWQGTKLLYFSPPPDPAVSSASTLSVAPAAGGSFLQFNYKWTYEGAEQSGVLLLGCDDVNAATAAWIDSFHMSSKIMFCTGTGADGAAELLGSYAAPPGPNWGWSIAIRSVAEDELQIVMHNISPEGQQDLAVQIDYRRSA
ncbi:MAG TPA: DUF1579 family protein [Chthoniobacterales bacterium]|nr:DUF1579 family protein [Chthoniobacterales bacterium]